MDNSLKEAKRYYIKQTGQYFKSLSKIEKKLDNGINKKQLHQIRLTIKNSKSIHQLLKIVGLQIKPLVNLQKQINQINKILGKIREHQVNRALATNSLLNQKLTKQYLTHLNEQTASDYFKLRKKLQKASFRFSKPQLTQIKKELTSGKNYSTSTKLYTFLLEKVESINQLLIHHTDEQQIHQIRKNLKLVKCVFTAMKMKGLPEMKELQKKMNLVQQQIGDWHDTIVFRNSLLDFNTKQPGFEQAVDTHLMVIEAGNLTFQNQLPEIINPLIMELRTFIEKKEPE